MPYNEEGLTLAIQKVLETVQKLRSPDGCPWDKEQTHLSLRPFLIEEAYETAEVLDQIKSAADLLKPNIRQAFIEEWGDVLLQILLHAEIASETHPSITFEQIAQTLNEKLIRRHPHVFGNVKADTSDEVIKNWDQIKKEEKSGLPADGTKNGATSADSSKSVFDGIPKGLPALPRTMKVIQKVTKVGFQWPSISGPTEKLIEEVNELKSALEHSDLAPEEYLEKVQSEIGDVLFSACNIAYFMKLDPESALRDTLRKFESRFRYVETQLLQEGKKPESSSLEEMDRLWDEAKRLEAGSPLVAAKPKP